MAGCSQSTDYECMTEAFPHVVFCPLPRFEPWELWGELRWEWHKWLSQLSCGVEAPPEAAARSRCRLPCSSGAPSMRCLCSKRASKPRALSCCCCLRFRRPRKKGLHLPMFVSVLQREWGATCLYEASLIHGAADPRPSVPPHVLSDGLSTPVQISPLHKPISISVHSQGPSASLPSLTSAAYHTCE